MDNTGATVAQYTYNAWGRHTSIRDGNGNAVFSTNTTHIANLNPFRYRGYYFDTESGFYYLNSRYYDSKTGRFINADACASTGQGLLGNNMFAYCLNNPVNMVDADGMMPFFLAAALPLFGNPVGAVVGLAGLAIIALIAVNTPAFQSAWEILWTDAAEAVTSLTDAVAIPQAATEAKADSVTKEAELDIPKDMSVDMYVGFLLNENGFVRVTSPMSFSETLIWVGTTAEYRLYDQNTNWGIYTPSESAAWNMGYVLSLCRPPLGPEDGYPSKNSPLAFKHYHPFDRELYGIKCEHFHIWFGSPL